MAALDNLRNKIIDKKLIEKILIVFLMLQPLLDFYFLFDEDVVNFFGFSPSTIVRIAFVGIIGVLFVLVLRNVKEYVLYAIYIAIVGVYVVFHHMNALNFTDFYGGYDFGYTLVSELFYIIRMLMPLFLIIVSAHYEFTDETLEKLTTVWMVLISGSIVVTNLLGVATGSYSKKQILGNIFYWFMEDRGGLNFMDLASKGLFLDPNRLAALLVLVTPLTFYVLFKNPSAKNKVLVFLNLIAMFMVGTKVSTLGLAINLVISLCVYLFFSLVKKEMPFRRSVLGYLVFLFVAFAIIYPFSPAINRAEVDNGIVEDYKENEEDANEEVLDELNQALKNEYLEEINSALEEGMTMDDILAILPAEKKNAYLITFIENYYQDYHLHYDFVFDCYPYGYDPEFWYGVMNMSIEERTNFRTVEQMMLQRVKDKNNNPMDDYLGITFTRMGNIFDLEKDFLSHYYTLGIAGLIIFLFPYLIITLVAIVKMLISFKKCATMKNVYYLLGCGVALCAAYLTGNVMDGLICTLILGFCFGQLINGVFNLGNQLK